MMLKDIPSYEGLYKVSEHGEIYSASRKRKLSPTKHKDGYLLVGLSKNSIRTFYSVHRLVALAFFGPSEYQVNHKNGIKDDNRACNLEYVSPKQNYAHAKSAGLINQSGTIPFRAKLTIEQVLEIRADKTLSHMALSRKYRVTEKTIRDIRSGLTWKQQMQTKKGAKRNANHINEKR